jgi:hypothetical protein
MMPQRVLDIANAQDDLIRRDQAIAAGASAKTVRWAVRSQWQVVLPGIYATFTGPLGQIHRVRAGLLLAGPGAMVTGAMGCVLSGLTYGPSPGDDVDVLISKGRRRVGTGFVRVHRSSELPKPRIWQDDSKEAKAEIAVARPRWVEGGDTLADGACRWTIPVAPAARASMDAVRLQRQTLLTDPEYDGDLPDWLDRKLLQDTRALLCEVVQRGRGEVAELVAELDVAGHDFTATAREAIADVVAGCRSAPECELRDLIATSLALPEPRWNQPLPNYEPGPGGKMIYPDACWPEARLVIEVNSTQWHKIGDRPERTEQRIALYGELSWTVLPISPQRIRREPAAVLRQIETAYQQGLAH